MEILSKCPNCGEELQLNASAEINLEHYNAPVTAIAKCCGYGVVLQRVIAVKATAYTGERLYDDWGCDLKPPKQKPENI